MQRVRRPKVSEQAAEQIKRWIVTQRLKPGDRLPTEGELAATFGISRLSVREATKALEFLGMVDSKTGVGLTVGRVDLQRVASHLDLHPSLIDADACQLIDSRIVIETGVLPYVAKRMQSDPEIEKKLRDLVDQFRRARDLKTWIELDIRFHNTLLEASGLQPLVAFGGLLHVFFGTFRESVKRAEWRVGIESHERLVGLLAANRVSAAVQELRAHIECHRRHCPGASSDV